MRQLKTILPVLLLFLLVNLACRISAGGPTPPPVDAPAVPEQNLEETLQAQLDNAASGDPVTITLTEQQLTGYIAQQLASDPDPQFRNPQIVLQNGQADLYGQVVQGPVTADAHMGMTIAVQDNGQLGVSIVSAEMGAVPIPDSVLGQLTETINQTLSESLAAETTGMQIESVLIGDGTLTISGRRI